ncbi:hypothetical protein FB451DRAFT_1418196 [Mycena latifolia]|nr:hypothetical protein FB451DRAFT_1418196 [Mycena latifolia]
MDSGSSVPPGVQIVQMSGPQLLSYLFHWGLFGALSVQLYLYYDAFPNDRLSTKCLVYTVYAIELVEAVLITQDAFAIFGYGFGDFTELTNIHLMWLDVPVTSGLVAFIGQSFYAYRVYVLSQSWIIPVLILVVSLISSIGAFFTGAIVLQGVPLAGPATLRARIVAALPRIAGRLFLDQSERSTARSSIFGTELPRHILPSLAIRFIA